MEIESRTCFQIQTCENLGIFDPQCQCLGCLEVDQNCFFDTATFDDHRSIWCRCCVADSVALSVCALESTKGGVRTHYILCAETHTRLHASTSHVTSARTKIPSPFSTCHCGLCWKLASTTINHGFTMHCPTAVTHTALCTATVRLTVQPTSLPPSPCISKQCNAGLTFVAA